MSQDPNDPNNSNSSNPIPITPTIGVAPNPTATGGYSTKFAPGRTWKRIYRIEQAVRMEAAGYGNKDIALHLGVHVQTVVLLKQTPEYISKRIEVATGIISSHDKDLRENLENQRKELESMVPLALLNIRTLAMSKNENIKLAATREILDREGNLAKISKTSVSLEKPVDMTNAAAVGNSLLDLLISGTPTKAEEIVVATTGVFTKSASDSTAQVVDMRDTIDTQTLDEIDLSDRKPN